jgi:putative DNA primase/helicase
MLGHYTLTDKGLEFIPGPKKDKDGNILEEHPEPIWICSHIEIISLVKDEDDRWGKLIKILDPDMKEVVFVMPSRMLATRDELWQTLLDKGVRLSSVKSAKEILHDFLNRQQPEKRGRVVRRLGWHLDYGTAAFVMPDASLGETSETFIYDNGNINPYEVSGSVEDWRDQVGKLCVGNSRLVLAASAAFASPMLELTEEESGGLHYQGNSRTGKTTALQINASVGGKPAEIVKNWRGTSNGMEGICEQRCDGLLCLDEMGQAEAREIGEIVYMIANGRGKSRMAPSTAARRTKMWRLLFLSSGEVSLSDRLTEIGKKPRAGQQIRLLDIPADAGAGMGLFETLHDHASPGAFAEHLRRVTAEIHGAPFRAYIEQLANKFAADPAAMRSVLRQARDGFIKDHLPAGASGQVRTACGRFGLIATAGELATTFGLTGWPEGEATNAALKCFRAWLSRRGAVGDYDVQAGIQQVQAFVERHGASRFEDLGDVNGLVHNRVGFRRLVDAGYEYLVFPQAWRDELCKGYDPDAIATEMKNRKLLNTHGDRNTTSQRVVIDGRSQKMRLYCLSPRVLGESEPDTRSAEQRNRDIIHKMMSGTENDDSLEPASGTTATAVEPLFH